MTDAENKKVTTAAIATVLKDDKSVVSFVLPDDKTINEVLREGANKDLNEDRFGTGGQHVARDLAGKTGWRDLDSKGPDPFANSTAADAKKRNFLGDEFQGMLGYDKTGKPAFWSHFNKINEDGTPKLGADGKPQPIESIDDLKGQTFKVHLATQLPKHLEGHALIEGMDIWDGKKAKDAAVKVAGRLEKEIGEYLNDLTKVTGLKFELTDKQEDANLTVMSWAKTKPTFGGTLLGFASFPESINSWSSLNGLGNKPAFMFLNNEWTESKSTKQQEVRNLFAHELGHNLGWAHPHDLARPNMSQPETLVSTLMAYADVQPKDFAGAEGAHMGAVDYGFRKWMPEAPALNSGEGKVYDLQAHLEQSIKESGNSSAYRRSNLLPTAVIVDSGKGTELHGTAGDDFIDTNKGYASIVNVPSPAPTKAEEAAPAAKLNAHVTTGEHDHGEEQPTANVPPRRPAPAPVVKRQKVLLAEGHIAKVKGLSGNNTIIASETGDQVIEPGTGNSEVRFYYQNIGGNKTIHSEGNDTLVLSQSIIQGHKDLKATEKDGNIVLGDGKDSITLSGKGVATIRIIDAKGQTVQETEVKGLNAKEINDQVIKPAQSIARKSQRFNRPATFAGRIEEEGQQRAAGQSR
ncbi:MAG: hypothetical protein FJX23_01035 [Alphaproteobacteria bacterium]|nr:hypothetical protein [Alphaproteobacteria bacterium]